MAEAAPPQAVFTIAYTAWTAAPSDMLGLWATAPGASAETVSFDAATVGSPAMPLWLVDLAADPNQAATYLDSGEAQLRASEEALALAEDRLKGFVAVRAAGRPFDVSSAEHR